MFQHIARIVTLLETIVTLLNSCSQTFLTPVDPLPDQCAVKPDSDESPWLEFDEEGRILRWPDGRIRFPLRKNRRFRFLARLWQSLGEEVDLDDISDLIGDHARHMSWDAVRMFGNRVETHDLAPVRCPFMVLQTGRGFRMIPRF